VNREELQSVLADHALWLASATNGARADLSGADLSDADLSRATGLLSASTWMAQLETCSDGWIVYKRLGAGLTQYQPPATWVFEPGAVLTETANPDRCTECGSGVNFGTREWCNAQYVEATLWRCLIRWSDGPDVVVPYNTDGKARCERLTLLEIVKEKES
jgi:hypothetical protein